MLSRCLLADLDTFLELLRRVPKLAPIVVGWVVMLRPRILMSRFFCTKVVVASGLIRPQSSTLVGKAAEKEEAKERR